MAKNRPRQNMSLGPKDGGFGSGSSNATTTTSQGGNGGNTHNRPRRRPNTNGGGSNNPFAAEPPASPFSGTGVGVQINQTGNISPPAQSFDDWLAANGHPNKNQLGPNQRERLRGQWQASGSSASAPTAATDGAINSIFTDAGSQASGGDKSYRETAWGLFNEGGISNDTGFAGNQVPFIEDAIEQLHTLWEGDQALEGDSRLPWDQWLYKRAGVPLAPGATPDPAFVQNTFGPAMRRMLTAMYQSGTPAARGVDSRQWTAPRRLIQF